jgi:acetylornithine deacetylase/succinyl-diaminopimelate desuccinylase-like protein
VTAVGELQQDAVEVLGRLIRFNTVNPPGDEREAIEWLSGYLTAAGLECEIDGPEPERVSLVATLRGERAGPTLGYLAHVDTVLADRDDWSRDPWDGGEHDGYVWGRGALDMKNQLAAEVVAITHLARSGWRPPRGELRLFAVADEETGGRLGAQWLCEQRPDLARCDMLLNEGGGAVMPYGDRRLYGVCCAEKGTFRFKVTARGTAGHASLPGVADNALLKLAPVLERLAGARAPFALTPQTRALLAALRQDPDDPQAALDAIAGTERGLAAFVEPALQVTFAPTRAFASEKINVIPARAEIHVDCRAPSGMEGAEVMATIREVLGDELEVEFLEQVVGNASPVDTPLMEALGEWIGDQDAEGEVVPAVLPAFTDSRHWRAAFPECVAYGFFPHRHMTLYETWPLIHGADERIDVRDLAFAASLYEWLPRKLLA